MALTYSKPRTLGSDAPSFRLKGVDGQWVSPSDYTHKKGLLIVFMCNHCPYVIKIQKKLNYLASVIQNEIAVIGINSNDTEEYPDDSFENMVLRAQEEKYVFPYLIDPDQSTAKKYDAACTPDIYLYQSDQSKFSLYYHGRFDELKEACDLLISNKRINFDIKPSMGCNIKWKN